MPTTCGGVPAQLLGRGAARVLVKWGARGAALFTAGERALVARTPVEVVDTTAAGDAFNGAFAVALADGAAEEAAGRFATRPGRSPSRRRGGTRPRACRLPRETSRRLL